jgi:hypothetical protein
MHIFRHGPYSAFEIVYRAAMLYANLREMPSGHLTRSAAYEGLDPSEKGAVSYFMGLALAKLFAERLLDVPWLMHVDVYNDWLAPAWHGTKKPDFVGIGLSGQWIAMESKGRTNGRDAAALRKAKEQVECLTSVQGQPVHLRVALQAYFGGDELRCALRDPDIPEEPERRIDLPLTREQVVESYYQPFRQWLSEAPRRRTETLAGRPFTIADVPEVDLTIGLAEEPSTYVAEHKQERQAWNADAAGALSQFVGADGVLVRAGPLWSQRNMRLEPQERRRE